MCLKGWSWREELNHPTVAGSAQKRSSSAPAEGASPLACSPRRGHIPFETPRLKVQFWSWREELNLQPAVYKTAALPLSYASQHEMGPHGRRIGRRKPNNCVCSCQAQAVRVWPDAIEARHITTLRCQRNISRTARMGSATRTHYVVAEGGVELSEVWVRVSRVSARTRRDSLRRSVAQFRVTSICWRASSHRSSWWRV